MPTLPAADRDRVVTTAAFAALAALACSMPAQSDTWWHLRAGLETAQGRSPFVDHFSWTVPGGFFWNHSWLAQLIFFFVHRAGDMPLLTALCASMVTLGWWLVWRECLGDVAERLLLLATALSISTITWSVRPQVAIVLLPVLVAQVGRSRLVATGLVMALWANLHAGFALGVLVLGGGVAAAVIYNRRALRVRLLTAGVGLAATLATPLGLTNWREIAASLARSRANAIIEWQSPGFGGVFLIFWALAAVFVVASVLRWRRLDSAYLQVSALAACLAFVSATRAMRNIPGFMMLALPPLSAMIASRNGGRHEGSGLASTRLARSLQAGAIAPAAVTIAWLWTHPTHSMGWRPLTPAAQSAIAECPAPMFNTYALGGAVIWFVPSQPVFVDSRQDPYPMTVVLDAVRVEREGLYQPLFDERGIRCAVLPRSSPAVRRLSDQGWYPRADDGDVVVLVRTGGQPSAGR
jgi:hypothetical protein